LIAPEAAKGYRERQQLPVPHNQTLPHKITRRKLASAIQEYDADRGHGDERHPAGKRDFRSAVSYGDKRHDTRELKARLEDVLHNNTR